MKIGLSGGAVLALAGLAVLGLGGLYLYRKRGAIGQAAAQAVDMVNPASSGNAANRLVSAAGAAVTGDKEWSLGSQLAEWFSPSVAEANRMLARHPAPEATGKGGQVVDPTLYDPYSPFMSGA
jgi:hypothetical protein